MSALAPTLPVADSLPRTRSGGTLDSSHDPASDRRRVINNEGTPAPDPQTGDRRKIIHRQPVAGGDPPSPHDPPSRRRDQDESHGSVSSEAGGTGGSEDGPAPDHDAAPPDRRGATRRGRVERTIARRIDDAENRRVQLAKHCNGFLGYVQGHILRC